MNAPEGRTLIFSFDGTGNEPRDAERFEHDESVSNILKLHVLMGGGLKKKDKSDTRTKAGGSQVTRYYNGIGTQEDGETIPLVGHLVAKIAGEINRMLAPSLGDAHKILKHAANDWKELAPSPDDHIVVFGFSRGAALARMFASRMLKDNPRLQIDFLGVFDTVVAMDGVHTEGKTISSSDLGEEGTLHERIIRAVHIVSLDENRVAFTPTLINRDEDHPDRITEVWCSGVHSDIGGGYWHDGLADISLNFMIQQCNEALGDNIKIAESSADTIRRLIEDQEGILKFLDVDDILIHPSVEGIGHRHTSGTGMIYPKNVRQVCVRENDLAISADRCRPAVHHSVKARFDLVAEYRPAALRGVKFDLLCPDGSKRWITGISGLREYSDNRASRDKLKG